MINSYSYTGKGFLDDTETIREIEDYENAFYLKVYRDYKTFHVTLYCYMNHKHIEESYTYNDRDEAIRKYEELLERR